MKVIEIKKLGFSPIIIKVYDNLSEQMAYELERETIKKIGRKILVNRTKGSSTKTIKKKVFMSIFEDELIIVVGIKSDKYELHDGRLISENELFTKYKELSSI